jgi:hypothetical protein
MLRAADILYRWSINDIVRICKVEITTARRWKRGAICPPESRCASIAVESSECRRWGYDMTPWIVIGVALLIWIAPLIRYHLWWRRWIALPGHNPYKRGDSQ